MRRLAPLAVCLLCLAVAASCGSSAHEQPLVQGEFTVRFDPVEGGCWTLTATDNTVYGPTNLDAAHRIDGLRVSATLQLAPFAVIVCPGVPVEIVDIAPLP